MTQATATPAAAGNGFLGLMIFLGIIAALYVVAPYVLFVIIGVALTVLVYGALIGEPQAEPRYNHRPQLHDGADTRAFPTRAAAEEYLAGAWLREVYGPMSEATDAEVKIAAANLKKALAENKPWN